MELQQLRYFKEVAETGNLTKASDMLHITPPTLSNSISRLEDELGAQLFDRVRGRLYLNEMGKVFLESSRTILNTLDSGCNNVRNMSILGKKILTVSTAVSSFLLSEIFADYLRSHPDVSLINKHSNVLNSEILITDKKAGPEDFLEKIAMESARLLWDKGYCAYLTDVIVDERYRSSGIGTELVRRLLDTLKRELKDGWDVKVVLLSAKGREGFYERIGFSKRPNETFGCGMDMWLNNKSK